jgi:hypothetical protein
LIKALRNVDIAPLLTQKEEVTSLSAFKLQLWNKAWKEFKENIKTLANIPTDNKKEKLLQTKWPPIQKNQMKHQVINKKPRHLIKKVIR